MRNNKNATSQYGQYLKSFFILAAGILGYGLSALVGKKDANTKNDFDTKSPLLSQKSDNFGLPTGKNILANDGNVFEVESSATEKTLLTTNEDELKLDRHASATTRRKTESFPYIPGNEFQINSYTIGDQSIYDKGSGHFVAPLQDSGFVVIWPSYNQDGDNWGIYGQRFNILGNKVNGEFKVNSYTTNAQTHPSVAVLKNGGFIVTWTSNNQDGDSYGAYGQRYNSEGVEIGSEFQINTYTSGYQGTLSVGGLSNGGFIATWSSTGQDGDNGGIYGQLYDAEGVKVGGEFQINSFTTNEQREPSVVGLRNGGFVVVWNSRGQGESASYPNYPNIFGRCYDSMGTAITNEFLVNTYTTYDQGAQKVSSLNDGGFVVVWQSWGQGESMSYVNSFGQRYDSTCNKVGGEFRLNTYTNNHQANPVVSGLSNGGFITIWGSIGQDGDNWGIYGQLYDFIGSKVGNEFQINTYSVGDQAGPGVCGLKNDGFVVIWSSNGQDGDGYGIYGRVYKSPIPIIVNNKLNICIASSGNTTTITTTNLLTEDQDTSDPSLMFTIDNLQYGNFIIDNNFAAPVTNFTQQAVKDGRIKFAYDESGNVPSYHVTVSDGTYNTSSWANVTVGYQPILITNRLTITQGQTVILDPMMLNGTATNATSSDLIFTISDLYEGCFNKTGFVTSVSSFSQQEVIDGDISFTHSGTSIAPSYKTKISAGNCETSPQQSNITFNNIVPTLTNNELHTCQNQAITVTTEHLLAEDMQTLDVNLMFTVSSVQYGQFERISSLGTPITSFTQQEVKANQIQFVHDGSGNTPSCQVKISDGDLETSYSPTTVTFTAAEDFPIIENNQLQLNRGQTIILTQNMLSATNVNNNADLIFTIQNVQYGQFERTSNMGVAITQFTQQDIINGQIQFVHDNSATAPSYAIQASEKGCSTIYQSASINFEGQGSPNNNMWPVVIGIGAVGACVIGTGVVATIGFFGIRQYQKTQKQQQMELEMKELRDLAKGDKIAPKFQKEQQKISDSKIHVPEIDPSQIEAGGPIEYNRGEAPTY